jgi:hypothetical protein
MARVKKFGVMGLFATGTVCVVIATVRVAQITRNVYKYGQGIDGTWLAIWGMVECSIGKFGDFFLAEVYDRLSYVGRCRSSPSSY